MSARQIAIGKALQQLEPDVLDLARMSHLVSEHAEGRIRAIDGDYVRLPAVDADALLFGVYDIDRRVRALKAAFDQAFREAPAP